MRKKNDVLLKSAFEEAFPDLVFTGEKSQVCDQEFKYGFLGTTLRYNFNTYHILNHSEEQLLAMDNRFALIMLAAQKMLLADKVSQPELAEYRFNIARAMISSKKYDMGQVRKFLYFLERFIYIEDKELNCIFDKKINHLNPDTKPMGIIETIEMLAREEGVEEGIEKGMKEGEKLGSQSAKRAVIENLLQGTDFDYADIASLVGVEESYVREVAAWRNKNQ